MLPRYPKALCMKNKTQDEYQIEWDDDNGELNESLNGDDDDDAILATLHLLFIKQFISLFFSTQKP